MWPPHRLLCVDAMSICRTKQWTGSHKQFLQLNLNLWWGEPWNNNKLLMIGATGCWVSFWAVKKYNKTRIIGGSRNELIGWFEVFLLSFLFIYFFLLQILERRRRDTEKASWGRNEWRWRQSGSIVLGLSSHGRRLENIDQEIGNDGLQKITVVNLAL